MSTNNIHRVPTAFEMNQKLRASIYILLDICLPWALLLTLLTGLGLIF